MATQGKIICFLAAFCIMTEAYNDTSTNSTAKTTPVPAAPPQNQFGFVFNIFNQSSPSTNGSTTSIPRTGGQATGGPSIGGGSVSYIDISSSSSSSSEEEFDLDMDMEVDINDVDTAPSFVFGSNGNRVSGNVRPMFTGNRRQRVMFRDQEGDLAGDLAGDFVGDHDQLIGRTSGTSGQGVGIALGVLGLLALVIAAAYLTIRKQRNSMATLVRVSSVKSQKDVDSLLNDMS